jgi:hypothetical protein
MVLRQRLCALIFQQMYGVVLMLVLQQKTSWRVAFRLWQMLLCGLFRARLYVAVET